MTIKEQAENGEAPVSPFRRMAIEAGPLVVFFIANSAYDIMIGTAAFMVATAISLAVSLKVERRVPLMPLISSVFVLLFGGMTLALDDEIFIKLKPTIVNLFFASVLLGGLLAGKVFLKHLMGGILQLDDTGWRILSWRWMAFFVFLAIVNEIVWRNFSTDTWVSFKVFGIMPLSLVFGLLQVPVIQKHQLPVERKEPDDAG